MKKKIVKRSLLGFPLGIAMGYLITILISLGWANGYYSPCVPELISLMGNEINAVILQTILCGILGAGFAASSVIWEMDSWSIVKQTGIYFSIISVITVSYTHLRAQPGRRVRKDPQGLQALREIRAPPGLRDRQEPRAPPAQPARQERTAQPEPPAQRALQELSLIHIST